MINSKAILSNYLLSFVYFTSACSNSLHFPITNYKSLTNICDIKHIEIWKN